MMCCTLLQLYQAYILFIKIPCNTIQCPYKRNNLIGQPRNHYQCNAPSSTLIFFLIFQLYKSTNKAFLYSVQSPFIMILLNYYCIFGSVCYILRRELYFLIYDFWSSLCFAFLKAEKLAKPTMPNVFALSYTRSCVHIIQILRSPFVRKISSVVIVLVWCVAIFFGSYEGLEMLNKCGMSNEAPKGSPAYKAHEAFQLGFPALLEDYYSFPTLIVITSKDTSQSALTPEVKNFSKLLRHKINANYLKAYTGYFVSQGSEVARAGRPRDFYVSSIHGNASTLIVAQGSWGHGVDFMYDTFDAIQNAIDSAVVRTNENASEWPDLSNYTVQFTGEIELLRDAKTRVIYDFEHADMYGIPLAWFILFIIVGAPALLVFITLPATILVSFYVNLKLKNYFHHRIQYPDFTPSVIVSIGVAMSIDYALFMMTRWLSEMKKGRSPSEALLKALVTAGRTVAVSGFIMFVSNAGLYFIDSTIISSFGIGLATCNVITVAVNLTLLPALIDLFGMHTLTFERWVKYKLSCIGSRARSFSSFSSLSGANRDPLLRLDDDFGLIQLTEPLKPEVANIQGASRSDVHRDTAGFFQSIKYWFAYVSWDKAGNLILRRPLLVCCLVVAIGAPVCFQVTFMKASLSQDNMMSSSDEKQKMLTGLMVEYGFPPGLGADYRAVIRPQNTILFPVLANPEKNCADDDAFVAKMASKIGISQIKSCAQAVQIVGCSLPYPHKFQNISLLPYYCPSSCPQFCRANSTLSRPFFDFVARTALLLGNRSKTFYNTVVISEHDDKEGPMPMESPYQYQESLGPGRAFNSSDARNVSFDEAKAYLSASSEHLGEDAKLYQERYHATSNYIREQAMINFVLPFHPFGQNARLYVEDFRVALASLKSEHYQVFFGGGAVFLEILPCK